MIILKVLAIRALFPVLNKLRMIAKTSKIRSKKLMEFIRTNIKNIARNITLVFYFKFPHSTLCRIDLKTPASNHGVLQQFFGQFWCSLSLLGEVIFHKND